jgi:hypothetical protein
LFAKILQRICEVNLLRRSKAREALAGSIMHGETVTSFPLLGC